MVSAQPTINNLDYDHARNKVEFDVYHIDLSIVNAIRRIILSEVENIAPSFDSMDPSNNDITFIENTSCLHNEFLGHRISLIPLHFDKEMRQRFTPDDYHFEINVTNQTTDMMEVTTRDIRVYDKKGELYGQDIHDTLFPLSPFTGDPVLIVKLNPNVYNQSFGEKLHVKFVARKGMAKDHSRYSPVSCCAYHNIVDEKKADAAFKEWRKKTPHIEENQLYKRFSIHDKFRHFQTNGYDEPCAFHFVIECENRMHPLEIFFDAFEILRQKIRQHAQDKGFTISALNETQYAMIFKNETHTLGNVIQSLFYNKYKRKENKLTFIGYYLTHPSIEEIVVKIGFTDPQDQTKVSDFVIQGLRALDADLGKIVKQLQKLI